LALILAPWILFIAGMLVFTAWRDSRSFDAPRTVFVEVAR
jgi:hypothetical protein